MSATAQESATSAKATAGPWIPRSFSQFSAYPTLAAAASPAIVKVTMAMRVDLGEQVPSMEQMPDVPGLPVADSSSAPPSVLDQGSVR